MILGDEESVNEASVNEAMQASLAAAQREKAEAEQRRAAKKAEEEIMAKAIAGSNDPADGYSENPIVKRANAEKEKAANREKAKEDYKENPTQDNMDTLVEMDLNELSNEIQEKEVSPNGYIPVQLSTKGFLGAPKLFHIRAFDTKDLTSLAMSEQEDLPIKLVELFDKLLYKKEKEENKISVGDFHTDEVVELTIIMIRSFISRYLKDIPYDLQDSDYEFQKKALGGEKSEEYKEWIRCINDKVIKPKVTIDIDALDFYPVGPETKTVVHVRNSQNGFSAKFSYPRYGDVAALKRFLDVVFKEQNRQTAKIAAILKTKRQKEDEVCEGNTKINYRSIPGITLEEQKELEALDDEKAQLMVDALKALHLKELNGVDVSKLDLKAKVELVQQEPRYTHEILTQVTEFFANNLKVGIDKEHVSYQNPITNKRVKGYFPFRLDYLLSALRDTKSDYTTIDFE